MASILKVDALQGVTAAGSILVTGEGNSTTTNLQQGLAKQWSYVNDTGTSAIIDSFNTTSWTDNGTGKRLIIRKHSDRISRSFHHWNILTIGNLVIVSLFELDNPEFFLQLVMLQQSH